MSFAVVMKVAVDKLWKNIFLKFSAICWGVGGGKMEEEDGAIREDEEEVEEEGVTEGRG